MVEFKLLDKIKKQAEQTRKMKRRVIGINLHQSIILMKLNICVAILQSIADDLCKLEPGLREDLELLERSVVNPSRIPYFNAWREEMNSFISELQNRKRTFRCLVYHKILSAVLSKYDELSKVYEDIYVDTQYDEGGVRNIVENKAKLISSIQTNPMKCLEYISAENSLSKKDSELVVDLFSKFTPSIIPATSNCLEEFIYSAPSVSSQYQLVQKYTNQHPLYPLVTIYTEWYKLRSFVKFFESFGNNVSSYCRGIESINGVYFELLYTDLVYLNYIFGKVYKCLDQPAQNLILQYMSIFSVNPSDSDYYMVFKKFALLQGALCTETDFFENFTRTLKMVISENEEGKLDISNKFYEFLRNRKRRDTNHFALTEVSPSVNTLSYTSNSGVLFNVFVTPDEWGQVNEEIAQLKELGGGDAIAALGFIVILKEYVENFISCTIPNLSQFEGFYTDSILRMDKAVSMKVGKGTSGIFDLNAELDQVSSVISKLQSYSSSKSIKMQAIGYALKTCKNIKTAYGGTDSSIDLLSIQNSITQINKMLQMDAVVKAFGRSTVKERLTEAGAIFQAIHRKLSAIDICIFTQNEMSILKPFDANRKLIELMARYLAKTFVKNEEVSVVRHVDLKALERPSFKDFEYNSGLREDSLSESSMSSSHLDLMKFDNSYKTDVMMLGIKQDSSGREVVPRNTDNKFYVFLRIYVQMCEYYMDSIIKVFGEKYDSRDKVRFDKFLSKLISEFQLSINNDYKCKILDPTVKKLRKLDELANDN
jgi:hypothetical protein